MIAALAMVAVGQSAATLPPPLSRMLSYLTRAKTFQTRFTAQVEGEPSVASGVLAWKRPSRMLFRVKWLQSEYTFAVGAYRTIEIESAQREYAEFAPAAAIIPPLGRLSGTTDYLFPGLMLVRNERDFLPETYRYKVQGSEKVGAVTGDLVVGDSADFAVRIVVAKSGAPLLIQTVQDTGSGPKTVRFVFSETSVNPKFVSGVFDPKPPGGFTAVGTPRELAPIEVGEPVSKRWLRKHDQHQEAPWSGAARTLLVVITPDSGPDVRAAETIAKLKGVALAVITTDNTGRVGQAWKNFRCYYDPTGAAVEALRLPGTPFFLMVNEEGRVLKRWFAFDPSAERQFLEEVRRAASATGKR